MFIRTICAEEPPQRRFSFRDPFTSSCW